MSEVVVSTRVRLARNLKNYPFVSRLSKEDRKKVVEEVREAFSHSDIRLNFIDMASLDKVQKLSLAERHIISPEFVEAGEGSALLISDDNTVAVMINEEDHIRLQVIKEGLSLKEAYETASYLDDVLSEHLELAFSERLGYLTQCPTNLGTAMRASVMLHLPALDDSGALSRIGVNLSKLGLVMRGLYGEGSKTYGAPTLGDNVYIGAGAKIIGGFTVGDNVRIGANCVVTQSIPANSTVVLEKPRVIVREGVQNNNFRTFAE